MAKTDANPLGLDGFAFCEFTSDDAPGMGSELEKLGFAAAATAPDRPVTLFRQGRIAFLVNAMPADSQAGKFRALHGPSANGMGFRVADSAQAHAWALDHGAADADTSVSALPGSRAIAGIGGSLLYLVDSDPFAGWTEIAGWRERAAQNGVGLDMLDHLTHNVRRGQMRVWSRFYAELFGFAEQKYFDIKGKATGLFSQAMIAPDGAIRIPLNESQDEHSQIEEFLRDYNGEGIQHIALTTGDIYDTVEKLRARGVNLQHTNDVYYDMVESRVPGHGETLERLRRNRILIDGDVENEGILLQIFTQNIFGPIFFEIIQRKGNQGFGNGNFQALYESIELDQIRRGVITVDG